MINLLIKLSICIFLSYMGCCAGSEAVSTHDPRTSPEYSLKGKSIHSRFLIDSELQEANNFFIEEKYA